LWVPIIVAILLIGGCILFHGSTKPPGPPGGAAVSVSAAPVQTGNIDITLNALGIVTPVYTVSVTSRVTGEITEVLYNEGQMVKKGDLLLVIDPRPYAAAVAQAEGQLMRDSALLENAQLDLSRYQDALKTHAIPEQEMATEQALVLEDQGTVKLDQGNLDAARINLEYTHIRSPIDGQVGLRLLDPGNIVAAAGTTPLVAIAQLQPITVIFTVAEDYLGEVTPESRSGRRLRVDALDRTLQTEIAEGALITLDNLINTATGTVRARALFANTKNELFPNQFVNAKLYVKTLTQVDLVPTAAIQRNDTAAFVYVIQPNGTVKSQPVTVTATEGDQAAVTGVQPGDSLITDGFESLQDGSKVTVRSKPVDANPQPGGS
jgi:multidrug efflux system membrane fusion protein